MSVFLMFKVPPEAVTENLQTTPYFRIFFFEYTKRVKGILHKESIKFQTRKYVAMDIKSYYTDKRRRRVKLIFNPASGSAGKSPAQLMDIINEMQKWKLIPEVYLTEPKSDFNTMVQETLANGINLFVVCGGDGTVSAIAKELVDKRATLGILPTGTRNNIALSLNIPNDISGSIAILRTGRRVKIDIGLVSYNDIEVPFLEICSVGLMSSLFSSGDDIQHGHIERIGDFLETLVTSNPAKISLVLENDNEINTMGHVVLISNMPYVGSHFKVGDSISFKDGLLDVTLFSELSKIDLLGCILKKSNICESNDSRIHHFRVRNVGVATNPDMLVMADGSTLGSGPITIGVKHHALSVMMGY